MFGTCDNAGIRKWPMIEIIDYKPEHALEIMNNAVEPGLCKSSMTIEDAQALANYPAKTGVLDGRIIGCGGVVIIREGFGEAWVIMVSDMKKLKIDPRIAMNQLWKWIKEYKLIRTQAPLIADWELGLKYARFIGFEHEAILKNYHGKGVSADMHVILGD